MVSPPLFALVLRCRLPSHFGKHPHKFCRTHDCYALKLGKWKVPLIARHHILRFGFGGTLQKPVIVCIRTGNNAPRRTHAGSPG
jgi:hypothetical protein